MKRYKWKIVIIIVFIIGFFLMLYPDFSNYWNSKNLSTVVRSYHESMESFSEEDYEKEFGAAEAYNEDLRNINFPFRNYDLVEGYEDILDISETGIMGYLTIDKINVELPIYHGTSEGVLQIGVGHLQGSSLPTGGIGNHPVLSAHNGLADAELFTNLDQMEKGDTFTVTVLDRKLTYQVDQIVVVEPQEFSELAIDEEKDYCTLLTCTPFGVNSHRLLVRGVRVDDTDMGIFADGKLLDSNMVFLVMFVSISVLALLIFFGWRCFHNKRNLAISSLKDRIRNGNIANEKEKDRK